MILGFGSAEFTPATSSIAVAPGQALRLNNSPYNVDDLTEKARTGTIAERLAFLRSYHEELCGTYAKRPRQFLALYFRLVDLILAADRTVLEKKAASFGGLFTGQDYAFSALRPLPQAHLPVGGAHLRADFALWTGQKLIALDIAGETRGADWADRCQRLTDAGVTIVELPVTLFVKNDPAALRDLLPPDVTSFWQSETMPSSPFKTAALGDIVGGEPEF